MLVQNNINKSNNTGRNHVNYENSLVTLASQQMHQTASNTGVAVHRYHPYGAHPSASRRNDMPSTMDESSSMFPQPPLPLPPPPPPSYHQNHQHSSTQPTAAFELSVDHYHQHATHHAGHSIGDETFSEATPAPYYNNNNNFDMASSAHHPLYAQHQQQQQQQHSHATLYAPPGGDQYGVLMTSGLAEPAIASPSSGVYFDPAAAMMYNGHNSTSHHPLQAHHHQACYQRASGIGASEYAATMSAGYQMANKSMYDSMMYSSYAHHQQQHQQQHSNSSSIRTSSDMIMQVNNDSDSVSASYVSSTSSPTTSSVSSSSSSSSASSSSFSLSASILDTFSGDHNNKRIKAPERQSRISLFNSSKEGKSPNKKQPPNEQIKSKDKAKVGAQKSGTTPAKENCDRKSGVLMHSANKMSGDKCAIGNKTAHVKNDGLREKKTEPSQQQQQYQQQPQQEHEPRKRVSANKKERRRTQSINNAFTDLRNRIPQIPPDTKLSKIKTLKLATEYIEYLMRSLEASGPHGPIEISFKPDLGKLRRESRIKDIKQEVQRKSKGRTGWPPDVWATELKRKFDNDTSLQSIANKLSRCGDEQDLHHNQQQHQHHHHHHLIHHPLHHHHSHMSMHIGSQQHTLIN